jgi:pimeloyl-ACP methyl ester carboxylesterase
VPRRSAARVHATPPEAELPAAPPTAAGIRAEWRAGLQVARLVAATPRLARTPRGDGGPVVLVPGWRSPEASMALLRTYLRSRGHDARHWGFGVNLGAPERDARRLAERVATLAEDAGGPVALVGWSLGGVVARETARLAPATISQVITYGTPVVGGPTHTVGAASYDERESARIAALAAKLDRYHPIGVPVTAIFTRRDVVVSWAACIDRTNPHVRHVEVDSTHFGLGIDPDVWVEVAERLAAQA